jgi:hypothetical protein
MMSGIPGSVGNFWCLTAIEYFPEWIENPVSLERMELLDRTAQYQVTWTSSTASYTDVVRKFRPLLRILGIN